MKTTTTTMFRADAGSAIRRDDVLRALTSTIGLAAERISLRDGFRFPFDLQLAADNVMRGWSIDCRISTGNGRTFDMSTRRSAETFTITMHEV